MLTGGRASNAVLPMPLAPMMPALLDRLAAQDTPPQIVAGRDDPLSLPRRLGSMTLRAGKTPRDER